MLIHILFYSEWCYQCQMDGFVGLLRFDKSTGFVTEVGIVFVVDGIFFCRKLHFAKVGHSVGAVDDHIDLCSSTIDRVFQHSPRKHLSGNACNAQRLFDLLEMLEADSLKGQALPSVADGRVGVDTPKGFIRSRRVAQELVIKQSVIVNELKNGVVPLDAFVTVFSDETTGFQILQHPRQLAIVVDIPFAIVGDILTFPWQLHRYQLLYKEQ